LLLKRLLVAFVFIPVFIFLIFKGGYFFLALVCAVIGVGLFEFYQGAAKSQKDPPLKNSVILRNILLGLCIPVAVYFKGEGILPFVITLIIFIIFFSELLRFNPPHSELSVVLSLGGILYISYLFSYIIIIREIPQMGERLVITVLFATWMGDTGAFTVGSIFGKHKFFPVYSSQKSIEGFIGAIFFSLIAMFISTLWVHFPILHVIVLGIIAGVGGEMGDFFESMLKRGLGIKDFGRILPGHGGVLDRFDSLFFTVPCFFYYIKYIVGQVAG